MAKKATGKRPVYFENPETDKLLAMVLALAEEVSVLRDRLDTIERLAQAKGLLSQAEIDAYQPDEAAATEREQQREAYIARILQIVQPEV
jgi:predicted  nucleic acid-binding Zn-ribbon protein